MDIFTAAILGLVQALTEFLPVSSSGHLVLAQHLLGVESETGLSADAVAVAVHFGTLLSVVLVFREDVVHLTRTGLMAGTQPHTRARWRDDPQFRMVAAICIGCLPAGVVGLAFKDSIEAAFESVTVVSVALLATGVVLLGLLRAPKGSAEVNLKTGFIIGAVQAVAIIPGSLVREAPSLPPSLWVSSVSTQRNTVSYSLSP